jgi:hypothetical protein
MTEPRRLAAPALRPILAISLATLSLACNPGANVPTPRASASAPSALPSLTPVPGGNSAGPSPVSSPVSQTDSKTAIGLIWDELPASFPLIQGAVPVETGSGPTSGTFAVGSSVADAVADLEAGLRSQGLTVDAGSPLEDGTVVLEAQGGPNPGCRIEVRFTPLSGTTMMAVLYGAACPFS